jgi:hypothetical protein
LEAKPLEIAKNLDVTEKFEGSIIILEDITSLKQALLEVKTLRGFLPICSYCKNIRNDRGSWQQLDIIFMSIPRLNSAMAFVLIA